jgi:O-antigen/teichoic acid export membrane protein
VTSTLRPTVLLMSGKVLAFAATFFIPIVLVRVFDPAAFGTYKQLLLVHATLFGISQLGMAESLFYFLPRARELGGRQAANALLLLTGAGLLALAVLPALAPQVERALGNAALGGHLRLLGLFLMLTLAAAPLEIVLISRHRHGLAAWSYGLSDVARALFMIVPAVWLGTVRGLLMGAVAFAALRALATVVVLAREFGSSLRPHLGALREQLAYALPFGLAALVETAQVNYHQYAVSHRFDAATFALYAVGCLQVPLVDWLAGPAGNVMMVRMAEDRGQPSALRELWRETTRQLALVFVPLVALLLLLARDVLTVFYTATYAGAAPVLRVWCLVFLLAVLQTDAVLRVFAQTPVLLALNLLRLALVAAAIPWLLGSLGLVGAAAATVLTLGAAKGLALMRIKGLLGASIAELLPWRALLATAVAAAAAAVPAAWVRAELGAPSLASLVLSTGAFGVAYAALAAALVLGAGERRALRAWAARAGARPWLRLMASRG